MSNFTWRPRHLIDYCLPAIPNKLPCELLRCVQQYHHCGMRGL